MNVKKIHAYFLSARTRRSDYFVVPLKHTSDTIDPSELPLYNYFDLDDGHNKNLFLENVSSSKAADLYLGDDRIEFRPEHPRFLLKVFVVLRSPSWKLPEATVTECSVLHHEYKKIINQYIPGC